MEIDQDGRLVAIDFKNVATPPTKAEIAENGQLGIYQLLLRDQQNPDLRWETKDLEQIPVGAALVQLKVDSSKPKIQPQEAIDFSQSPTWIEVKLGEAAEIIRTESFTPKVNPSCRYCPYKPVCSTTSTDIFNREVIEEVETDDN